MKAQIATAAAHAVLRDGSNDNQVASPEEITSLLLEGDYRPSRLCDWMSRSVATPQPNLFHRAVSASSCVDESTRASSDCGSYSLCGRPTSSSIGSSSVNQRPLLIRMHPGGSGLAPDCISTESTFGSGSHGLGSSRLHKLNKEAMHAMMKQWETRKERYAFEERQRMQSQHKAVKPARLSPKQLHDYMLMAEYKRTGEARKWAEESKNAAKDTLEAQKQLRREELDELLQRKRATAEEHARRKRDEEMHQEAMLHIARLQLGARKIETAERHHQELEECELKRDINMQRNEMYSRLLQMSHTQLKELRSKSANDTRMMEEKLQRRLHAQRKAEESAAHDFVKKLSSSLKEDVCNARSLVELRKSRQRDRLKKESEELAAKRNERRSQLSKQLQDRVNECRIAESSAQRTRVAGGAADLTDEGEDWAGQ